MDRLEWEEIIYGFGEECVQNNVKNREIKMLWYVKYSSVQKI